MDKNTACIEINDGQLKALQEKSLELLLFFKDFCEKNDLTFYLIGGGLIGAIRHGGFIPWDDDLDVFMPRDDFNRLQSIFNKTVDTDKYYFEKTTKDHYTRLQLAAVVDESTTFVKQRQCDLDDVHHGVRIDVLPIDGCPKSRFKRKCQILWALVYSMFIVGEPHTSKGKLLELVSRAMLFFFPNARSRYKVWHFAEKRMSRFKIEDCDNVTELCSWYEYMVNEYPRSAFEKPKSVDFEGCKIPAPTDYDTYLKTAFGDYMTPPPPNQRFAKHDVVAFDLCKSYKSRYKND